MAISTSSTEYFSLLMVLAGGACAGHDPGSPSGGKSLPLTCEIVAHSCWYDAVATITACAPGAAVGALSTTRTTCTYPSSIATFDPPIPASGSLENYSVRIETDHQLCGIYADTHDGLEITTSVGTAAWSTRSFAQRLTCPNGTAYEATLSELQNCSGFPPVEVTILSSQSVTVALFKEQPSNGPPVPLVTCNTP
jgi:hypothetical protein